MSGESKLCGAPTLRTGKPCRRRAMTSTGLCSAHNPERVQALNEHKRRHALVIEEGLSDSDLVRAIANAIRKGGIVAQRRDLKRQLFVAAGEYDRAADEWDQFLAREEREAGDARPARNGLVVIQGGAA